MTPGGARRLELWDALEGGKLEEVQRNGNRLEIWADFQ